MNPQLSMIIPCYMEAKRLPPTLAKWKVFIEKATFKIETILVVEPSQDGTLAIAKDWQKKMEGVRVRVIENPSRLGKGGSVRRGLLEAKGEVCAFMDADGATDFSFFYEGFQAIRTGGTQVVIASRGMEESIITMQQSAFRKRLGLGFRWMTKFIIGLPFEDTQCGAKMFHSDAIYPLFFRLHAHGFAFDVEVLLKAKWRNISVLEIPCNWKDIKGSTVHPIVDGYKMLQSLLKLKLYYIRHPNEKSVLWGITGGKGGMGI